MFKFILSFLLFVSTATLAIAESKPKHYQTERPQTEALAIESFKADMAKVQALLSEPSVGVGQLEMIHQVSYSLEASVQKLAEKNNTDDLKHLATVVEELHLSSEKHSLDETKKWFQETETAFLKINAAYSKSAK